MRAAHPHEPDDREVLATPMIDPAILPQPGETIFDVDGPDMIVAWCSGWVWPLPTRTYPKPTTLYVQPVDPTGTVIPVELRVIAGYDVTGQRFWIAERRLG